MRLKILTDKSNTIRVNCGAYLLEELVRRADLKRFLTEQLPARAQQSQYNDADLILGLAYGIFSGIEHLEDINEVKRQLDCDFMKIPSSDTLGYRMNQLSVPDQKHVNAKTQVVHYFNCNKVLNKALIELAVRLNPEWKQILVTLDYDNTIIPAGRDGEATYKKVCGYQPGIAMINNQPVYIEGRNGNSNSPYLMNQTLERMYDHLEKAGVQIGAIRIDAAAYNKDVFEWLDTHPEMKYYVGCRKQSIDIVRDADWESFYWDEVQVQATSIEYAGPGMYEQPNHRSRLVVYRQKSHSNQQDLFWEGYQYRFILTNDFEMTARQVAEFYNLRGASERTFEYLKYDFNWLNLPFGKMNCNTTYLLITAMCYLIYRWILKKLRNFPRIDLTIRVKKFNLLFMSVAGKWITTGRRQHLKLYSARPYRQILQSG